MQRIHNQVHQLDPGKWSDKAAKPVNQEVTFQEHSGAQGTEMNPTQSQRDEGHDDEGIENDSAEHRTQG